MSSSNENLSPGCCVTDLPVGSDKGTNKGTAFISIGDAWWRTMIPCWGLPIGSPGIFLSLEGSLSQLLSRERRSVACRSVHRPRESEDPKLSYGFFFLNLLCTDRHHHVCSGSLRLQRPRTATHVVLVWGVALEERQCLCVCAASPTRVLTSMMPLSAHS